MLRSILAVSAGVFLWTVMWLGTNGALAGPFPEIWGEGVRIENTLILLLIIGYSLVFSLLAGWLTAWVAGRTEVKHAVVLGLIQVAFGLLVTVQLYATAPLWYHVVFVALLLPGNVLGARLRLAQKTRGFNPRA